MIEVTTDIEYEDSNGNSYDINKNPYKANESMSVPVMQELRLEIEDINVPEMAMAFQPFELYVEFFNMGKSTLSNMLISTEGDFQIIDGKFETVWPPEVASAPFSLPNAVKSEK